MVVIQRIGFLVFVVLLSGCGLQGVVEAPEAPVERVETSVSALQEAEQAVEEVQSLQEVVLVVDFAKGGMREFAVPYDSDLTAFSVLESTEFELEIEEYSFGSLVTGINGVHAGTNNNYWIYYVNDGLGTVAADSYELLPGDSVKWSFEKDINL